MNVFQSVKRSLVSPLILADDSFGVQRTLWEGPNSSVRTFAGPFSPPKPNNRWEREKKQRMHCSPKPDSPHPHVTRVHAHKRTIRPRSKPALTPTQATRRPSPASILDNPTHRKINHSNTTPSRQHGKGSRIVGACRKGQVSDVSLVPAVFLLVFGRRRRHLGHRGKR